MSDDLVSQLTLNFLINKEQLQKLKNKRKESTDTKRKTDREIYGERIQKLFSDLLVNNPPEDLLSDVKIGFDFFVDKAVYYFKAKDNHELLEHERNTSIEYAYNPNTIHDDIDYDKEDKAVANGTYKEDEDLNEDLEEDLDEDDDRDLEEDEIYFANKTGLRHNIPRPINGNVSQKYLKNSHSQGVNNIQNIQLDWCKSVKLMNDASKITPRTKN
jgi:hypothetical protein